MRLTLILFTALVPSAYAESKIISIAPSNCLPFISFTLTNQALPDDSVGVYAVEDNAPAGCNIDQVGQNGRYDTVNRKIKWGPFFDHAARVLTYRVTPGENAADILNFSGQGAFDTTTVSITGIREVKVIKTAAANEVRFLLPSIFQPGGSFILTNVVSVAPNVTVYAVENNIPAGWAVAEISDGGIFDSASGRVKWGPYFDHDLRVLTLRLSAPAAATLPVLLAGRASFDGVSFPVAGSAAVPPLSGTVTRELPLNFQVLVPFEVIVQANPGNSVLYAVEEQIPPDAVVTQISDNGTFDFRTQRVKWGPFFDATNRTLHYWVTSGAAPPQACTFSGSGSFDGYIVATRGPNTTMALSSVVRSALPDRFFSGTPFTVTNFVTPGTLVGVYALEENVPSGWTVSDLSDGGVFDSGQRKIKWGPFFDSAPRVLTFSAAPGQETSGTFSGLGSFDGIPIVITGMLKSTVYQPGDVNTIIRHLPPTVRSGTSVTIIESVSAAPNISVYAVEETLPVGWQAVAVSDGGVVDSQQRKIKWGPFFDAQARELRFDAVIPSGAAGLSQFSGLGSFDGNPVSIQGGTATVVVQNHLPVGMDDVIEREFGAGLVIPPETLLANDSDLDLDALILLSIPAATQQGVLLTLSSNTIVYQPATSFNIDDSFVYQVGDGFGGTAFATVQITVRPPAQGMNIASISAAPGGGIQLSFTGIPGISYHIQATVSLAQPDWVDLGVATADDFGTFEFTDTDAAQYPSRFYRSFATL